MVSTACVQGSACQTGLGSCCERVLHASRWVSSTRMLRLPPFPRKNQNPSTANFAEQSLIDKGVAEMPNVFTECDTCLNSDGNGRRGYWSTQLWIHERYCLGKPYYNAITGETVTFPVASVTGKLAEAKAIVEFVTEKPVDNVHSVDIPIVDKTVDTKRTEYYREQKRKKRAEKRNGNSD